jgi:esterase/lipase superfamily enzyme
MTRAEIYNYLLRCNAAQLDVITIQVGLNSAFIAESGAGASRAKTMLELAQNSHLLPEMEAALRAMPGLVRDEAPPPPPAHEALKQILLLSSNPLETEILATEEEKEVIERMLSQGPQGRSYRVKLISAFKASDLSRALLEHSPTIVHFSGHGSPSGDLVLTDAYGKAAPVPVEKLAELFAILQGKTECVVLNACYSTAKASVLAAHTGCVVGMDRTIGDASALSFSEGFYRALAFGQDYKTAFQLGSSNVDLDGLPDGTVPRYTVRSEDRVLEQLAKSPLRNVPRSEGVKKPESPRIFPVWFGTDRMPVDPGDLSKGFAGQRSSDPEAVYFGKCEVVVPKWHEFGELGSSWWHRLMTGKDDRLKLQKIHAMAAENFWTSLRGEVEKLAASERVSLVFIHGFCVSFEESALRAAQLGFDLGIPGATAFYSWPSRGKFGLRNYTADEATISVSAEKLAAFLVRFAEESGSERVHVLAHSMGNRGLLSSFESIGAATKASSRRIGHIIFAAPDEDSQLFTQRAKQLTAAAETGTLYVSSKDRAVKSSNLLHLEARAGFVPPVTTAPGIDTIEVSNVDLSWLGHGYFAAAEGVLYDMRELLIHNTPAGSRARLDRVEGYWRIRA